MDYVASFYGGEHEPLCSFVMQQQSNLTREAVCALVIELKTGDRTKDW